MPRTTPQRRRRRRAVVVLTLVSAVAGAGLLTPVVARAATVPTLTGVFPVSGAPGSTFTLRGAGFDAWDQDDLAVRFGPTLASGARVDSDTAITGRVPSTAGGLLAVGVSTPDGASTTVPFRVTPRVSAVSTTTATTTPVQLVGAGFGAGERLEVRLDGTRVDIGPVSSSYTGEVDVPVRLPHTTTPGVHQLSVSSLGQNASAGVAVVVRTDWTQPGGSAAHTGLNAAEFLLGPDTAAGLATRWSAPVAAWRSRGVSGTPAVADGLVVTAGADGSVTALDATTGALRWTRTPGAAPAGSPVVADGRVHLALADGTVVALDEFTGAERWRFAAGSAADVGVTVAQGVVLAGFRDRRVVALDAVSGDVRWTRTDVSASLSALPAVSGDTVAIGRGVRLEVLDLATGARRWTTLLSGGGVTGALVISGGRLFGVSTGHGLQAFRLTDGRALWTSRAVYVGGFAVDGRAVYVAGFGGQVSSLAVSDGATRWTAPSPGAGTSSAGMTLAGGLLWLTTVGDGETAGRVVALDAGTGSSRWSAPTGRFGGTPVVVDGTVTVHTVAPNRVVRFGRR